MSMLRVYVDAWHDTMNSIDQLGARLSPEELAQPTDCPGWSVKDVLGHLAHLEAVLAGHAVDRLDNVSITSDYTNNGVDERRDRPVEEVLAELSGAVTARAAALESLPDDPASLAPVTPAGMPWSWDTLLRNRTIDAWVHEQDIRRAINQPGNLGSAGAQVVTHAFAAGMPYVLGKKVGASPGTGVRWEITGEVPLSVAAVIGSDGRAQRDDALAVPNTTIRLSTEAFTVLAAGRQRPEQVPTQVDGDVDLAAQVLAAMTLTF